MCSKGLGIILSVFLVLLVYFKFIDTNGNRKKLFISNLLEMAIYNAFLSLGIYINMLIVIFIDGWKTESIIAPISYALVLWAINKLFDLIFKKNFLDENTKKWSYIITLICNAVILIILDRSHEHKLFGDMMIIVVSFLASELFQPNPKKEKTKPSDETIINIFITSISSISLAIFIYLDTLAPHVDLKLFVFGLLLGGIGAIVLVTIDYIWKNLDKFRQIK